MKFEGVTFVEDAVKSKIVFTTDYYSIFYR